MTDEGDYYLRMPDGIFLYFNFQYPQYTLGDGQSLEFKGAKASLELEEFIRAHLSNQGVYFDVGANNGYYYCLKIAKAYPSCRIHAFEPDCRILRAFRKNIEFNGAANVTVASVALSDVAGVGRMPACMGASGYLVPQGRGSSPLVEVKVSTLDHYVREQRIGRLDVVKVDIEGGEYRLLVGGQETLTQLRPLLVMELSDELLTRSQASAQEVVALLRRLGYEGYRAAGTADAVFLPEERSAELFAVNRNWLEALESVPSEPVREGPLPS